MTRTSLCTVAEAINAAGFNNKEEAGGTSFVQSAIDEADEEIFGEFGDPPKMSTFSLDNTQLRYEFRNDNKQVYRIDKVIIRGDNNERIVYTAGTASESALEYTEDLEFNTISFAQETVDAYSGRRVEVQYSPNTLHLLVVTRAALYLLEQSAVTNAQENAPSQLSRLRNRAKRLEQSIRPDMCIGSEDNKHYDETYGVVIPQRRFWTYN